MLHNGVLIERGADFNPQGDHYGSVLPAVISWRLREGGEDAGGERCV